jgi:hypothetical protein
VYETLGWQPSGAARGTRFPYQVQFANAIPRMGSAKACDPAAPRGTWDLNYNTNGHLPDGARCP